MIEFHSSANPTIGVEIELQLIDKNTFGLNNIASKVLSEVDKKFSSKIKAELFESMIEINTDICSTIEEVEKDIKEHPFSKRMFKLGATHEKCIFHHSAPWEKAHFLKVLIFTFLVGI